MSKLSSIHLSEVQSLVKVVVLFAVLFFLPFCSFSADSYTISAHNKTWCAPASYPSTTESASFSLCTLNGGADDIQKNKTGVTIILSLTGGDGNFLFDGTGSVASDDLTDLHTVSVNCPAGGTTITVTYSTSGEKDGTPCLTFTGFGVYAASAGSGGTTSIERTGGSGKIKPLAGGMHTTASPAGGETFGDFLVSSDAVYNSGSSAVAQASAADVSQYSFNQEILQVKINTTGLCNNTVSSLVFNPAGDDGSTDVADISGATVYYTGTSSTFATTTMFGAATPADVVSDFTVTGSQELEEGDVYFWLVYDIAGGANATNKVDAKFVSFTMSGTTYSTIGTASPGGSRTIIAASNYYSIDDLDWESTDAWETTDGGGDCNCFPSGGGVVYVRNTMTHTAMMGDVTVDVLEVATGKSVTGTNKITTNGLMKTVGTGFIDLTKDISSLQMEVGAGGRIEGAADILVTGGLTVNTGGTLRSTGAAGMGAPTVQVQGDAVIDGTIEVQGVELEFDGATAQAISGTAGTLTLAAGITFSNSNKSFASGSSLTVGGALNTITISGAITFTNNGTITTTGTIDGSTGASAWTQGTTGTLNYGATTIFGTSGVLNASATGNTVNYNNTTGVMNIPVPSSSQYHHLTLTDASFAKSQTATLYIGGTFTNTAGFSHGNNILEFNGSTANEISAAGTSFHDLLFTNSGGGTTFSTDFNVENNFTYNSITSITPGTNKVTFTGGAAQLITGSGTPDFYDLTLSNGIGAAVTLGTGINISHDLVTTTTLTHGSQTVTLNGTSAQAISGGTPPTFHNLVQNGTGGTTVNVNVSIAGALTLTNGLITPGGGILKILDGGSASAGSSTSYVNGALTKVGSGDFTFPVGSTRYGEVTVSGIVDGSSTTEFIGQYFDAAPTNPSSLGARIDHISAKEYWDVANDAADVTSAIVTLSTTSVSGTAIVSPAVATDLLVVHYNGASWDSVGVGTSGVSTSFSPFAYGSKHAAITLPVELLSFSGDCVDDQTVFNWSTGSEINNDYFEVLAGSDGISYESVGLVEGAGNSNTVVEYEYACSECQQQGYEYYKLKQVDYDDVSKIGKVTHFKCDKLRSYVIYPSFVNQEFTILFNGFHDTGSEVFVTIVDQMGKVMLTTTAIESKKTINIGPLNIGKGLYYVVVQSGDYKSSKHFVKL